MDTNENLTDIAMEELPELNPEYTPAGPAPLTLAPELLALLTGDPEARLRAIQRLEGDGKS